jgi:hypothetical protein
MLVLTKPAEPLEYDRVSIAVEQAVSSYIEDTEETEHGAIYTISAFAPFISYSMFAPFSKVEIERTNGKWVLKLRLSKFLLIPYAIATFGLLMFRTIGPMGFAPVLMAYALMTSVLLVALLEARLRVGWWWRSI